MYLTDDSVGALEYPVLCAGGYGAKGLGIKIRVDEPHTVSKVVFKVLVYEE